MPTVAPRTTGSIFSSFPQPHLRTLNFLDFFLPSNFILIVFLNGVKGLFN
jgi:hypothetical protein